MVLRAERDQDVVDLVSQTELRHRAELRAHDVRVAGGGDAEVEGRVAALSECHAAGIVNDRGAGRAFDAEQLLDCFVE
ncbi:hypothetical protein ACFPRL_29055 [Pseudoclavibacter helvolus]